MMLVAEAFVGFSKGGLVIRLAHTGIERLRQAPLSLLAAVLLTLSSSSARAQARQSEAVPALKIGGLVQADSRFFARGEGTSGFLLRRARLDVQARLTQRFHARLQAELAGGKLALLDAYVGVQLAPELELQLGKLIVPVGLELYPRCLAFPEFGLPSLLEPSRDVGLMLSGLLAQGTLAYAVGVFNGVADGTSGDEDENDAKDVLGRVFAKPLLPTGVRALSGLGVGFAATFGKQQGALPTYRSPGRQVFFGYDQKAIASGPRLRLTPQGYYYYGPLGLLAEYVYSSQDVNAGAAVTEVSARAFQLVANAVIGGTADYRGTKIKAPFDPAAGTWGALELDARYGQLWVAESAFAPGLADAAKAARRARNLGAAVSWWFAPGTRAHLALDRTTFRLAVADARRSETVLVLRLQAAW
jgi:phosphate-selective porin OprO/OprP